MSMQRISKPVSLNQPLANRPASQHGRARSRIEPNQDGQATFAAEVDDFGESVLLEKCRHHEVLGVAGDRGRGQDEHAGEVEG